MYKNTELMCIDKTDRCFFQDKVYLILAIANTYRVVFKKPVKQLILFTF